MTWLFCTECVENGFMAYQQLVWKFRFMADMRNLCHCVCDVENHYVQWRCDILRLITFKNVIHVTIKPWTWQECNVIETHLLIKSHHNCMSMTLWCHCFIMLNDCKECRGQCMVMTWWHWWKTCQLRSVVNVTKDVLSMALWRQCLSGKQRTVMNVTEDVPALTLWRHRYA